jgi:hypothetical protein
VLGPPGSGLQGPTSQHMAGGARQQSPVLPTPTPYSPQPTAVAPRQAPHRSALTGGQQQQRAGRQQQQQLFELLVELACLDRNQQALLGLEQPPPMVRAPKRMAEAAAPPAMTVPCRPRRA